MVRVCLSCPQWPKKTAHAVLRLYPTFIHQCVLCFRRVWQHIIIQASTSRKFTMIASNCTRRWRLKPDRYDALLLVSCLHVWRRETVWLIVLSSEGCRLSSTRQRSNCFNTSSSGRDEVPDDPHALACDRAVPHRTRRSEGTVPSGQYRQGTVQNREWKPCGLMFD